MKKALCLFVSAIVALAVTGCSEEPKPVKSETKTTTNVNVNQYLMDAEAFDMASVIAKLKEGSVKDAEGLQKFINETSGINNVDLDKDGNIDTITVKEERGENGKIAMAVVAHPKDEKKSATIAEVAFEKNTSTDEITVSGSYPNYVSGHQDHYYRHTLTGSMIGDMMFYSWLFSPRPVFYTPYTYGMYGYGARPVLRGNNLRSTRTTYRTQNKVTTVSPTKKPAAYKPATSDAKKMAKKVGNTSRPTGGTLKSKQGSTKSFSKTTGQKKKAPAFKSKPSTTRKSSTSGWGRSSSRSFGSRSFGSRRSRSSAVYKTAIEYLTPEQVRMYAEQVQAIPLSTWRYKDEPTREHLGFIVEDVAGAVCTNQDHVDLYSYTSMAVAAIQVQAEQIQKLQNKIQSLEEKQLVCSP